MPELPDIEAYCAALRNAIGGSELRGISLHHPFLLRSVGTPPNSAVGARIAGVSRLGKRIVLEFDTGLRYVIHLMIAGRLRFKPVPRAGEARRAAAPGTPPGSTPAAPGGITRPSRPAGKGGALARFEFSSGELTLTEAGSRRRASLHVLGPEEGLSSLDPGGREVVDGAMAPDEFAGLLREENHTIKRSLTDPRLFSGIGNAYSDEILFAARLSPFAMTQSLGDEELTRLYGAVVETLGEWRDRLVAEAVEKFPAKVTAFRPEMHVHGKYGAPCGVCGTPVQRIRYAENECNYCPTCQTGGKVYADRALSRLLKDDWPRTVEELEKLRRPSR